MAQAHTSSSVDSSSTQSIGAIFPSEIQNQILRHLDRKSLINLRGTNRTYRDTVDGCQCIWKIHHDERWSNGKCRNTWLATKGLTHWSSTNNWTLHAKKFEDEDWFGEFLRRSRLDQSVHSKLMNLTMEYSQTLWYDLMVEGKDIVDCLKSIIAKEKESLSWSLHERTPLQVTAEKALLGISRCIALQEWKFLHDPTVKQFKLVERLQLEDGAMTIAKFCEPVKDIITHDKIHQFEEYTVQELDSLAEIVKNRLNSRFYASIEEKHSIMTVVEEMKFLFDSSGEFDDVFKGNVDDYYDAKNSLISQCLRRRTGIPIMLAVIYTSIVWRVCGVQMDIIGLPGHVVLGVPFDGIPDSARVFVDPFNGGRILSYADCAEIVTGYNIAFHPRMVTPLSNEKVWERTVANLIQSHSMRTSELDNDDGLPFYYVLRFLLSDNVFLVKNFTELVKASQWYYSSDR